MGRTQYNILFLKENLSLRSGNETPKGAQGTAKRPCAARPIRLVGISPVRGNCQPPHSRSIQRCDQRCDQKNPPALAAQERGASGFPRERKGGKSLGAGGPAAARKFSYSALKLHRVGLRGLVQPGQRVPGHRPHAPHGLHFCCTFRGLAPPRRYLAPCPVEPGLSSPRVRSNSRPGSDCLADSLHECSGPGCGQASGQCRTRQCSLRTDMGACRTTMIVVLISRRF
jgi:hypothetical protein